MSAATFTVVVSMICVVFLGQWRSSSSLPRQVVSESLSESWGMNTFEAGAPFSQRGRGPLMLLPLPSKQCHPYEFGLIENRNKERFGVFYE
jgi:hypothetical protein